MAIMLEDIENEILDYFTKRFRRPPAEIDIDTDIKEHFNLKAPGVWQSFADAINDLEFMDKLNVSISQSEMTKRVTARALAALIWQKIADLAPAAVSTKMPREKVKVYEKDNIKIESRVGKKIRTKRLTKIKKTKADRSRPAAARR